MKTTKHKAPVVVFLFILLLCSRCSPLPVQNTSGIPSGYKKGFLFQARSAMPAGGTVVQLTAEFDIRVTADSVVSHLPYFGRAFNAGIYPGEGGIKFTSTRFTYTERKHRKGNWQITITPEDVRDVQQMFFNISPSGAATLQVTLMNRQPITFNGLVLTN